MFVMKIRFLLRTWASVEDISRKDNKQLNDGTKIRHFTIQWLEPRDLHWDKPLQSIYIYRGQICFLSRNLVNRLAY